MKTRRELRQYLYTLKTSTCMDCLKEDINKIWPPEAMQYDHILERGPKIAQVSSFVNSRDESGLLEEIKKCDLVCANHHAIRTRKRGKSAETRARMSQAQKLVQARPDVKAKVREAVRQSWRDPVQRKRKVDSLIQSGKWPSFKSENS